MFGCLLLFVYLRSGDAFEVNGVPFRIWVAQHPDFQIQDPLAAVGTNAIPHLIRILHEPAESRAAYEAKAWLWKHLPQRLQTKFYRWYPVPRWQLKRTALFGLRFLGPEAKAALPEVLQLGREETNTMVRASALVAALQIAPEDADTFSFWRDEWNSTNFSRHDLAIYLRGARCPVPSAVPLLMQEAQKDAPDLAVLEAFEYFGEAARPAVPYMSRLAVGGTYRGNMTTVLRRLGPVASDAVPAMVEILNNSDADSTAGALTVLKAVGIAARPAAPHIQVLLTNSDSTVRMLAATTLARLEDNPEIAISVLLDELEQKHPASAKAYVPVDMRQEMPGLVTHGPQAAVLLLGELGSGVRAALPALERQLEAHNEVTRILAARAVWRVGRNKEPVLPVLLKVLDSKQPPAPGSGSTSAGFELILAIEALEELGSDAKEAVPALERVRTFSMLARRAATQALARINAGSP